MAKRKPGVNDIIYELDNDDSELSSEDEVKQSKISRIEEDINVNSTQSDSISQCSGLEIIDIDSSTDKIEEIPSPKTIRNGGKSPIELIIVDEVSETSSPNQTTVPEIEKEKKFTSDTIFNEDIIIDSPVSSPSDSDPGVIGCENKTPLVTVKFRDSKIAMNYKKQIKAFMLNLIKLHGDTLESDNETDLELDIWPEDLVKEDLGREHEKPADNLFFIDTDPSDDMPIQIPNYRQNTAIISNVPDKESSPDKGRKKGPICFNCNGSHTMRECQEPWNNTRIAENRKLLVRKGRYHVEDEQKYGHLVPGRISGQLRHALGLKRHEMPVHIYRMRQLGYPPGWLEEARISHSGITLFDSSGLATLDPEDEEGELCDPGSKDKFDIKKILDFPGFNVPPSSRYKEEAHKLGLPPVSEADSKLAMLAVLAPNAMKAYKRKKLTLLPSGTAHGNRTLIGTAEMDIDSGDEVADFPSQPPLPDEAPPPPPPPPDVPPPPDSPPPERHQEKDTRPSPKKGRTNIPNSKENSQSTDTKKSRANTLSDDDLEVIEVMKVADIPVPFADIITIDVDGDVSEPDSGLASPSLDDLEQKKLLLLDALSTTERPKESKTNDLDSKENDTTNVDSDLTQATDAENDSLIIDIPTGMEIVDEEIDGSNVQINDEMENTPHDKSVDDKNGLSSGDELVNDKEVTGSNGKVIVDVKLSNKAAGEKTAVDFSNKGDDENIGLGDQATDNQIDNCTSDTTGHESNVSGRPEDNSSANEKIAIELNSINSTPKTAKDSISADKLPQTPNSTMGLIRDTRYGTPVINVASPYLKLPTDDKFAKDICDVINFENLPNSTGKYKQISTLLKKVKGEVDRIQDS